ncbi:hypothetical protein [Gemmata palustris]|nr:hypothetical protein [Gemmata palustris]
MTEEEWLVATNDPTPMLDFLRGKSSDRKLRLFACECVRKYREIMGPGLDFPLERIELCERYADGLATHEEWWTVTREQDHFYPWKENDAWLEATRAVEVAAWATDDNGRPSADAKPKMISFVRDIFGNPFCPVAVDPSWLTSDVIALATGIYVERAFDRLPILADALQDAGCDNDDILNHLRGDGPHVKGCWALDLVLGKS